MTKDEALKIALEALEDVQDMMSTSDWFNERVEVVRQALADLDTGTDRGAWADVPDATKWVDELRGDDEEPAFTDQGVKFTCGDCPQGGCCEVVEPPNSTTDVVEPVAWIGEEVSGYRELDWDKEDLQREYQFVYPLYTAPPKREWQGLTDEEIADVMQGSVEGINMLPYQFARAIEAKLKEKNT